MRSGLLTASRLVVIAAALAACGDNIEIEHVTQERDAPVELDEEPWEPPIEGEPSLTLGLMADQLFAELPALAQVPVGEQFQFEGAALAVSVQATGVARAGRLRAEILYAGENISDFVPSDMKLHPQKEGYLERRNLVVGFTEWWQDENRWLGLIGETVTLSVAYTDTGGRLAESAARIVLVED